MDGRVRASAQIKVNPPPTPHVTANQSLVTVPDSSIAPSDMELGEKDKGGEEDNEGSGNPPHCTIPHCTTANG